MGLTDYYLTGGIGSDIDDNHDSLIDDLVTAKLVSGHSSEVDSSMILIRNLLRHFLTGGEATYSSATVMTIAPLTCLIGDTPVQTDVVTTLTLTEDTDWVDGSAYSFSGGAGFVYVYVKTDGTIAFSETAPTYSDGLGNQVGKLRYHKDGSNDYWRVVCAIPVTTSDEFIKFTQAGDWIELESPSADYDANITDDTWTDVTLSIPSAISNKAIINYYATYSSGVNTYVNLHYRINGSSEAKSNATHLDYERTKNDSSISVLVGGKAEVATDASGIIEVLSDTASDVEIYTRAYHIGGIR